jgi:adenylate cyclase
MPRSSRAGIDDALASLRRALELDPHYTMAKGLGAFACMSRIGAGYGNADDVKAGLRYADEALQEQDDDPSILAYAGAALATLGYRIMGFRVLGFRYDEAQRAIERALSLSPNLLMVQFCAGQVKGILGDGDAALGHFEQAMRISPLDPAMSAFIASTGGAHLMSGRYEQALAATQLAIQDSPNFAYSHRVLVLALGFLGRIDEAQLAAQHMLELAPEFTVSRYQSMSPVKDPEYRKRAAELYRAAGVPK